MPAKKQKKVKKTKTSKMMSSLKKAVKAGKVAPIEIELPKMESYIFRGRHKKSRGLAIRFYGKSKANGKKIEPGFMVHMDFKELLPPKAYKALVKASDIAALSIGAPLKGMKEVQKKINTVLKG